MQFNISFRGKLLKMRKKEAPARFELTISCLLDRRFNQLSHGAIPSFAQLKLSQHGMILQNYT